MEIVKNHHGKYYMISAALLTAAGQLLWKLGFANYYLMAFGFICYGGGAILMIKAFSLEKLSVAYPLMCLSYIFALILGSFFLAEPITYSKIIAIAVIILGVILTNL